MTAALLHRIWLRSWRALIAWSLGLVAILSLYLPLYRSLAGGDMQSLLDSLPPELVQALGYDQIGTGAGYTQATFSGLIGFLLLTIAVVGWGAAAIGGAEETGGLELDLAHGVSRSGYALAQAVGLVGRAMVLGLVVVATISVLNSPSSLGLSFGHIVLGVLALLGVTLLSGTAALLVAAATGRRVWGIGVGAGVAVVGYALNAVANQAESLQWLRRLSPYAWAYQDAPLEGGGGLGILVLWLVAAGLAGVTVLVLGRRDITG